MFFNTHSTQSCSYDYDDPHDRKRVNYMELLKFIFILQNLKLISFVHRSIPAKLVDSNASKF